MSESPENIEKWLEDESVSTREKLRRTVMLLKERTVPDEEAEVEKESLKELKDVFLNCIEKNFPKIFKYFQNLNHEHKVLVKLVQIFELMLENYKEESLSAERSQLIKSMSQFVLRKEFQSSDWRSIKKIIDFNDQINFNYKDEENLLFEGFLYRINFISQTLLWIGQKLSEKLVAKSIQAIETLMKKQPETFKKSLTNGRFEKKDLGNDLGSIVVGDEGGLFMLFNTVSPGSQSESILIDAGISEDFLNEKRNKDTNKVVLGEGSFGKVRLALSILGNRVVSVGQVVCVKKSKPISAVAQRSKATSLASISDSTLEDFYAIQIGESIYSPKPLDMAILTNKQIEERHRKGVLVMELAPQNTADKVFKDKGIQKWEYQKPYILEIMRTMRYLLQNSRILNTDLKPENTLFDPISRKMAIIDIGSSLYVEKGQNVLKFDASIGGFGVSQPYCPPELIDENQNECVNLEKAASYLCGVTIAEVTSRKPPKPKRNDDNQKLIWLENWELGACTDLEKDLRLKFVGVLNGLMEKNPAKRLDISEGLQIIENMGSDEWIKRVMLEQYIFKVKEYLKKDLSSLNLNTDIQEIKAKGTIPQYVVKKNPNKYPKQDKTNLCSEFQTFFREKGPDNRVLLLLGEAGSGKSLAMQLEFIKEVENWEYGNPLPIFFNLADEHDLVKVISRMNTKIGSNLSLESKNDKIRLFIDSYDENSEVGVAEGRRSLIDVYLEKLKNWAEKQFIITCRTDFVNRSEDFENYSYFLINSENEPQPAEPKVFHIAPMFFGAENQKIVEGLKNEVDGWLKRENIKEINFDMLIKKSKMIGLENVKTGLLFNLVMKILLKEDIIISGRMRGFEIYKRTVQADIESNWYDLTSKEQEIKTKQKNIIKKEIESAFENEEIKNMSAYNKEEIFIFEGFERIGEKLAARLTILDKNRLKFTELAELITMNKMSPSQLIDFPPEMKTLWQICKILGLKIERSVSKGQSNSAFSGDIAIGFRHETYKNYYLLRALKRILNNEAAVKNFQKNIIQTSANFLSTEKLSYLPHMIFNALFSNDKIIKNKELLRFFGEDIKLRDQEFGKALFKLLEFQKGASLQNKHVAAIIMSILVAGDFDFSNLDFNKLNLSGANLTGANFRNTKFTRCNLRKASLRCADISGAVFESSDLSDLNHGVWPSLKGHTARVRWIDLSIDGQKMVSCSDDKTVKIWEMLTGDCYRNLEGHTEKATCVHFRHDGMQVLSGGHDCNIKIWDISSGECIKSLQENSVITSVRFSPDGSKIAGGMGEKEGSLKVWDTINYVCLHSISYKGFSFWSIQFNSSGNWFGAAVPDDNNANQAKLQIWDSNTGKLVHNIAGHHFLLKLICFSPDGNIIVGASYTKIQAYDTKSGKKVKTFQTNGYVDSLCFNSKGNLLLSVCRKICQVWDYFSGDCLANFVNCHFSRFCIDWSKIAYIINNDIKFYNTESYTELLQPLEGHSLTIRSIKISPDGKRIISSGVDKTCKIWDLTIGECLQTLRGHSYEVVSTGFSLTGDLVASSGFDYNFFLWDSATGECLKNLFHTDHCINNINFSLDEKWIYCSVGERKEKGESYLNLILRFDLSDKKENYRININKPLQVMILSHDGKKIVGGDSANLIILWNSETREKLLEFKGGNSPTLSLALSPDNEIIVSGGIDQNVILWSSLDGTCLALLGEHQSRINYLSFSSDGAKIGSIGEKATIKIWKIWDKKNSEILYSSSPKIPIENCVACFSQDWSSLYISENLDIKVYAIDSNWKFSLRTTLKSVSVNFSCLESQFINCKIDKLSGILFKTYIEQNKGTFTIADKSIRDEHEEKEEDILIILNEQNQQPLPKSESEVQLLRDGKIVISSKYETLQTDSKIKKTNCGKCNLF